MTKYSTLATGDPAQNRHFRRQHPEYIDILLLHCLPATGKNEYHSLQDGFSEAKGKR